MSRDEVQRIETVSPQALRSATGAAVNAVYVCFCNHIMKLTRIIRVSLLFVEVRIGAAPTG